MGENIMTIRERLASYNWTYIIIGIIFTVAVIGSIILSILTYAITTTDEKTINTHRDRIALLESELMVANAELDSLSDQISDSEGQVASINDQQAIDIAVLQVELATATEQLTSLVNQINNVALQISSLNNEVTLDRTAISTITTQLSSITTELSALSATTASLQSKLTSLESKVNSLKATVDKLTTPVTHSVVLFSSQLISQAFGTQSLLYNLTTPYAGYISITGTSSSSTAYIRVTNNNTGYTSYYPFGTGNAVNVAVSAGQRYSLYFGNSDAVGTVTATLSAVYFY
jgi:peptidoglycan hydrolase CwlO-like protein